MLMMQPKVFKYTACVCRPLGNLSGPQLYVFCLRVSFGGAQEYSKLNASDSHPTMSKRTYGDRDGTPPGCPILARAQMV